MKMKKILLTLALLSYLISHGQNLAPKLIETISGQKYGYVNSSNKVVIKPIYDEAFEFIDGYAPVVINKNMGLIDSTGTEVVPLKYKYIGYLQEGLIPASLDGIKFGFIN